MASGEPDERPIVIASNRGPVSFTLDDSGAPVARRGGGGLVSALLPLVAGTETLWIAAAMTEGDRVAAASGSLDAAGVHVRLLDLPAATYRAAYDVIGNATLWFVHHGLFDAARRPRIDHRWWEAWDGYRRYNEAFADAVADAAPEGATVLVQDYHLCLVGGLLAARRPDLVAVHFHHTPFAGPDLLHVLPRSVRAELLGGLAAHRACGFHSERWARSFRRACEDDGIEPPHVFVSPLAPDPDDLAAAALSDACARAFDAIGTAVGERQLIVRVDRIELSKNLVRGFLAFDRLLERHPEHREAVVMAANAYPSREGLAEYLAYRSEVEAAVRAVNERWGTPGWTPILLDLSDDFPTSVAALRRYDVLLVNPVRDGLNLVAKEGPLLNERDGVVALSTEAGAFDELADAVLAVDPCDVEGTAETLHRALVLAPDERRPLAAKLRRRAGGRTPADWLAEQRRAAG